MKSSSVIARRMQSAAEGDSRSSFPLMDIMFDKLLCTPLQTVANTCIQKPILAVLEALDKYGGPDEQSQLC